jgi:hypothetical protein
MRAVSLLGNHRDGVSWQAPTRGREIADDAFIGCLSSRALVRQDSQVARQRDCASIGHVHLIGIVGRAGPPTQ